MIEDAHEVTATLPVGGLSSRNGEERASGESTAYSQFFIFIASPLGGKMKLVLVNLIEG